MVQWFGPTPSRLFLQRLQRERPRRFMMAARRTKLARFGRGLVAGAVMFVVPSATRAQDTDAAALDKLLAPIALYPDALLAQVLTAQRAPIRSRFNVAQAADGTGSDLQQAIDAGCRLVSRLAVQES
jgi:hypothetical protein